MAPRPHTANSLHTPSRLTPLKPDFPSLPLHQTSPEHHLSSLNPQLPSLGLHLTLVDPPKNGPVRYPLPEIRPLDDSVPRPIERSPDGVGTVFDNKAKLPWGGQLSTPISQKGTQHGRPGTADPLTRFQTSQPDPDPGPTQKGYDPSRQISMEPPTPRPTNISSMAIMSAPDLTTATLHTQNNLGQVTSLSPRPVQRDASRLPPPSSPPERALPPIPATPAKDRPVVRSANGVIVSPDSPLYEEFAKQAEIRCKKEEALSNLPRRPPVQAVSMPIPKVGGKVVAAPTAGDTARKGEGSADERVSPASDFRNVYLALMRDDRDDHEILRPSEQRRAIKEEQVRSEQQQDQQSQSAVKSRHGSLVISKDDQRTMEAWFADERYGGRGSMSDLQPVQATNGERARPRGDVVDNTKQQEVDQVTTPKPLSEFRFPIPVVQPLTPGNSPERIQRLSMAEDLVLRNSMDHPERACIWESVSPLALAQKEAAAERRRATSPTGSASMSTPHLLTSLVADMKIRRPSSRSGQASLNSRVKETAAMFPMTICSVQLERISLTPLFGKSPFGPDPISATATGIFGDKSEDPPIRRLAIIRARLVYYHFALKCLRSAGEILYADNISTLELLQSLRSAGEELNQRPSGRILDHGMALDKAVQVEEAMNTWWKGESQRLNRLWRNTARNIRDLAEEHGRLVKMVPSEKILEIKVFEKGWIDDARRSRAERKARKWIQEAVAPAPVDEEYLTAISRDMELKGQLPGGAFRRFHHLAVSRRGGAIKEDQVDLVLRGKIEGDLSGMMRSWGSIKGRAKAMVKNLGGKGGKEKKKGGEVFGMIDTRYQPHQPDILGSFLQMDDGPVRQAVYGTHMSKSSSGSGSGGSGNSGGGTGPSTAFPTPESYVSRFKYKYRAVMNRSATHLDRYPDAEDRSIYVDPAEDDRRCPWPCAGPVPAAYRGTFAPVPSPPQRSRAKMHGIPWEDNVDDVRKGGRAPRLVPAAPVQISGPSGPRREVWELEENQPDKVKERQRREEVTRQEMKWARKMGAI